MEHFIRTDYATLLEHQKTNSFDPVQFYKSFSDTLMIVAEHYHNPIGEEVYMGFISVAKLIENLSRMYKTVTFPHDEIQDIKAMIKNEYECILNDLEYQYESYPDEITKRDIQIGRILTKAFSTYENN